MNLTDGNILCGRKYFDGTGGNNHAVEHFKTTGFPIAVKLGTITASGGGRFTVIIIYIIITHLYSAFHH